MWERCVESNICVKEIHSLHSVATTVQVGYGPSYSEVDFQEKGRSQSPDRTDISFESDKFEKA